MSCFTRYIAPGQTEAEVNEYKESNKAPEGCGWIRDDLITDPKLTNAGFRLYSCIKGQEKGFPFTDEFFFKEIRFTPYQLKKTIKHLKEFGLMKEGCGWEIFD